MRNITPGLLMWLIAAILIVANLYYVYDFSTDGTMYTFGELVGSGIGLVAILWFVAKKYSKWMRVSSGVFLAAALLTFHNWDEIRMSFDVAMAKPLIAAAKTEDELVRIIAEHPDNRSLRILGIGLQNASGTREQVATLYAGLEPAELQQLNQTLDALAAPDLVSVARALRSAQRNAHDAANSLPGIYRDSVTATASALNFVNVGTSKAMISGIKSRHEREVPHLVKSFLAQEAMYGALADQAEFLLARQGAYAHTSAGVQFSQANAVEPWNALFRKTQATIAEINAVETERLELEKYQAEGWAKMTEGLN